ncbi:hypothetical protein PUV54_01310 [Hyphococcus flavus]|uniref:Uncharacterized protein n=1 Tax=Hyphococcus flavus TaxID=1866326 RepID=A0AAE9ZBT2_9PROT|nr:hypothetical protein [Hyphococcus flavus]WDI31824.1 hypothetical protein PUV54_01310 [Hyphococcus flavus]
MTDQDNKMNKPENPEAGDSYQVNPHYHELLVTHAAKAVIDEVEARNDRSRNMIITGLSAVIALLMAGGGFLVNELLDMRIETRVNTALERELSQARLGMDAARLSFQAAKIDIDKDFDDQEAVAAIEKMGVWYNDYVENEDLSAAERAASKAMISEPAIMLLDVFSDAGRLDLCLRLLEAAPRIFEEDPDGSFLFAVELADQTLSAPDAPQSWFDENSEQAVYYGLLKDQLKKLSYRSFPEVSVLTNAMLAYLADTSDTANVRGILEKYAQLNETDKASFDYKVEALLSGGFTYELDSSQGRLMRDRTVAMLGAVCPLDVIAQHCEALSASPLEVNEGMAEE